MPEGKNGNGEQTEKPRPGEAMRCHRLMDRILDVVADEFPDISPPRFIFVLEWIKHRYLVEIEDIVRSQRPPSPEQPEEVKAAPIVCKI
jgi:hypothetical protein